MKVPEDLSSGAAGGGDLGVSSANTRLDGLASPQFTYRLQATDYRLQARLVPTWNVKSGSAA